MIMLFKATLAYYKKRLHVFQIKVNEIKTYVNITEVKFMRI